MFESPFEEWTRHAIEEMLSEIDRLTEQQLSAPTEELIEYFVAKYRVDIPMLHPESEKWEEAGDRLNPSGQFNVRIHFDGDGKWFGFHGRSHPVMLQPSFSVANGAIEAVVWVAQASPESKIQQVKQTIERIDRDGLGPLRESAKNFNATLAQEVRARIKSRLSRYSQHNSFLQKMSTLVPIKRRDDGSEKLVLPMQRKTIPLLPKPTESNAAAEPQITMQAYEDILSVITSMVHVFERSPSTFSAMGEEDLRMILLVALNGIYQGRASGETFNGEGDTDILIREGDRNVFIAECLVWDGPEYFRSKINDQLLKRYATWRDSKLAVLVFNRKKDFSSVIAKMKDVCDTHPQRIDTVSYKHESAFRYIFRREDDPQRQLLLTAMAFDVPTQ